MKTENAPSRQQDLLKRIAERGFEVGYAANLNFATHDIADKVPVLVSFISTVVGILALVSPFFQLESVAVCLVLLGIVSLYVEKYPAHEYGDRGKSTMNMLHDLETLYYKVKDNVDPKAAFQEEEEELWTLTIEFIASTSPHQILFATWYANYKFFAEKNYAWIDEQLHFRLWRDKIPATLKVLLVLALVTLAVLAVGKWVGWLA